MSGGVGPEREARERWDEFLSWIDSGMQPAWVLDAAHQLIDAAVELEAAEKARDRFERRCVKIAETTKDHPGIGLIYHTAIGTHDDALAGSAARTESEPTCSDCGGSGEVWAGAPWARSFPCGTCSPAAARTESEPA